MKLITLGCGQLVEDADVVCQLTRRHVLAILHRH